MSKVEIDALLGQFEIPPGSDPEALIKRVVPRTNKTGKVIGQLIELTDGTRIPYRKAPKKRKPKRGPAAEISLSPFVRALVLIQCADSYSLFSGIRLGTCPHAGGGPAHFPRQLWSLLYVLQNSFSTQQGLVQWLKMGVNLRIIINMLDSLREEMSDQDRRVYDRWRSSSNKIPSRSRVCTFFSSLSSRGWDADAELAMQGIQLCIDLDRYNPNRPATDMTNAFIGDGTVLKAACNTSDPITMDFDGKITARRVDTFAMMHTEAGDQQVYGAKGAALWSPSPDRHGTICLGFDWVEAKDPKSEAAVALRLAKRAQGSLSSVGRLPSNYAYDRAAGYVDQETLNSIGMYLTTRAIGDQLEAESTSHYLNPKYIGTYTPSHGCKCNYQLFAIQKALHLQVLDDTGKDAYIPLSHSFRTVVVKGKRYSYTDHSIPCQSSHGQRHIASIPWNGWQTFNNKGKNRLNPVDEKQYQQILRYLQPHAPGTEDFHLAFGIRQRTETMHSVMDALLPFKILQRWGKASKSGFVYGFLMGHNIVARMALTGIVQQLLHPDG